MLRNPRWRVLATIGAVLALAAPWTGHAAIAQDEEAIQPDVYEPDDGPEQAHPLLLVGIPQPHTFHTGNDVDWIYFDLDAGERVAIMTTGDCDTFMTLYGPDGRTALAQDDDSGGGGNAALRFTSPAETTFFVEVRQFGRSAEPCGPYGLVGEIVPPPDPDPYEPDDTPAQAKPLPLDGSTQEHSIHRPGDVDWVTLTVQPNTAFRISTSGNCDTYLTLFGPDTRTNLAEDDDSGQLGNAQVTYTFTQAGTYYLQARLYDQDTDVCDTYGLSAVSVPPSLPDAYEPDDAAAQAKPLPLDGSPQQRSLHTSTDLDWVTFTLNAGDRVLLYTTGSCDTYLFLVSPDGRTILAEDDDTNGGDNTNASILFQVQTAGTYYGVVRLYSRSAPPCPSYQLQGTVVPGGGLPQPSPFPAQPGAPTPVTIPSATATSPTIPGVGPTTITIPGAIPTPRPAVPSPSLPPPAPTRPAL